MRIIDFTLIENRKREWWELYYSYFINYNWNRLAPPDKPEGKYEVDAFCFHATGLSKTGYIWLYRAHDKTNQTQH